MLNCRRCQGKRLIELGRLNGSDHPVYRCRHCGFLFSPPEQEVQAGHDAEVERSQPNPEARPAVAAGHPDGCGRGAPVGRVMTGTAATGPASTNGSAAMR